MRRSFLFIFGLVLLFGVASLPKGALADTSIADITPAPSSLPTASPTDTPVVATDTPVVTVTPDPSGLADTGSDTTVPFMLASLGIVALSIFQLRRKAR